jgi:hypothetical protein
MSDALTIFAADYAEARAKFLKAATARGCALTAHAHPTAKGPKGEDLFVDVAIAGPDDAAQGLLLISGTHGVEGYAGSACQVGWLESQRNDAWPAHLKVVMIHALNPYGFAWNRRVNEENVDLNRNFIDHGGPYPKNLGYEELKQAIVPPDLKPETLKAADQILRAYAKKNGAFALQEAISKGQYDHPDGVYFGGTREQWSAGIFRHVVKHELIHCREVGVVDFHTGLGPYGYGELICEDLADTPAYRRARNWWGDTVRSTQGGESVSAHVTGSLDSSIPGLLPHTDVTMASLEFGTYSTVEVFQALRADNWLHVQADPLGPEAKPIKTDIRCSFYPDSGDWKDMVWQRAEAVLGQAVRGLTATT